MSSLISYSNITGTFQRDDCVGNTTLSVKRKLTSWAQRDTALQKKITLTDERKSRRTDPEDTLEKIGTLIQP